MTKVLTRTEAREKVMIALYQIDLIQVDPKTAMENASEIQHAFMEELVFGVIENMKTLDATIEAHLKEWSLGRLGRTDRSILRIGAYELLMTDTPEVVAINEAIELAKKYSDDQVVGIINSVLDQIYKHK